MGYDMRQKSISYTNWRVKEMCFNGDEERDDKIWSAYAAMRLFYNLQAGANRSDFHDENPKTAFWGACGVCCSELIENEAPEPIMAAFLCGPAMDHNSPEAYLGALENSFGEAVRYYVEDAATLRRANLTEYNKLLAKDLPEEVLAIETAALWCATGLTILDYQSAERTPDAEFERHEKLLLCKDDSLASELLECYNGIAVLLAHIKPSWRLPMMQQRAAIAWVTEWVYDSTVWPLPEAESA